MYAQLFVASLVLEADTLNRTLPDLFVIKSRDHLCQ
jgi:hypothetical protein